MQFCFVSLDIDLTYFDVSQSWIWGFSITADPCKGSPCQNDGQCVNTPEETDDFACVCQPLYSGPKCEKSM